MKIYLIRHAMTKGNLEKRYIGVTDEDLCAEGILQVKEQVERGVYSPVDCVFTSPMKRCIQTAELIYPEQEPYVIRELSECSFGVFENRNHLQLQEFPFYQSWVASGGTLPFPGGESRENFTERCILGFQKVLDICRKRRCKGMRTETAACIVHGGTIMSIMEKYAVPHGGYYDFQVKNTAGFCLWTDQPKENKNYKDLQ